MDNKNTRFIDSLNKDEWQNTFDSVPDLITILDTSHTILKANEAVFSTFNKPKNDIIGKKCFEVMHGLDCPPPFCPYVKLLKVGSSSNVEIDIQDKTYLISVDPIYEGNTIIGSVHIARDITDIKKIEVELQEKKKKLYDMEIATTMDLLHSAMALNAGIAHELRTPLQAIINVIELLYIEVDDIFKTKNLSEERKTALISLVNSAEENLDYSVNILDSLSAYAKSGFCTEVHLINILDEVRVIIKALKYTDKFKYLTKSQFYLDPRSEECYVRMNKMEFRQIVENLCRNSIEAINTKEIKPSIKIKIDKGGGKVRLHIIDNGLGIPEKFKEDIFKPYFSTKEPKEKHNQGLGLAIVKNLVLKAKGEVYFYSKPGETEFIVSLECI